MKKFPSDNGLIFLVCDDFRQENGGKTTLLGVYGNTLVAEKGKENGNEEEFAIPSLAFYTAFSDGEGEFTASIQVKGPDGTLLLPPDTKQIVSKKSDGWLTLAFKMMPFRITPGTHTLVIYLDDKEYARDFYVQLSDKQA